MTATVSTSRPTTQQTTSRTGAVVRATGIATIAAAAATEAYTAVVRASGVHLAAGSIGGTKADVATIGPGACSIMVVICTVAGLLLALGINRLAKRPQRTYYVSAAVLTVLSFVPDVLAGATATSSKITLMGAHVIAAAIVIPLVGRRLAKQR